MNSSGPIKVNMLLVIIEHSDLFQIFFIELETAAFNLYKKCYVTCSKNVIIKPEFWCSWGPLRFYFSNMLQDENIVNASGFCAQITALQGMLFKFLINEKILTLLAIKNEKAKILFS